MKLVARIAIRTVAVVVTCTTLGSVSFSARADDLCYNTQFERPHFMPGQVDGQDGWQNPHKTALISVVEPIESRQSVQILGSKLNDAGELLGTRFGLLKGFDAAGKAVDVGVDAKLKGPGTPGSDLVSGNLDIFLTDELLTPIYIGAVGLSSAGYVLVYDVDGVPVAGVSVDLDEVHRLGARVDFDTREVEFFADGNLVSVLEIDESIVTNIFAMGALSMFAIDDRSAVKPNKYRVRFDGYCVTSNPECAENCILQYEDDN